MAARSQSKHLELSLTIPNSFFPMLNGQTFAQTLFRVYWLFRPQKRKENRCFYVSVMFFESYRYHVSRCGKL